MYSIKSSGLSTILILLILTIVVGIVGGGYLSFIYSRDIDAYLQRAQIAGNTTDMQEYLRQAKEGLEKYNATKGHTAYIFRTPMTNLALHYKAIQQQIIRLEKAKDMDVTSVGYQTLLDDARGTIRELPALGGPIVYKKFGFPALVIGLILLVSLLSLLHIYKAF